MNQKQIAAKVGLHPSIISREISRNRTKDELYDYKKSYKRKRAPKIKKLDKNKI